MKKIIKIFYVLTIILLTGLFHKSGLKAQTVNIIKVVGDHAPPYRIIQEEQFSGIYFDVMKEIGKRIGIPVEFVEQPFRRALRSMRQGITDVMVGPNKTPEREAYMVYTRATVGRANKAFYVHPNSPLITRYQDLKDKSIITHRGKVYFDKFDKDTSLEKVIIGSYEQAIEMVARERSDVVIIPETEGDYLLKLKQNDISLKKSPFIIEGNQSYITISKRSPVIKLQKKIEEAMNQIKLDGTMEKILSRYRLDQ